MMEFVDLGLPSGIKWATCNLGANAPEQYGDYFAWGEIRSKEEYTWSSYKWCKGNYNSIIKYCCDRNYGYNRFMDNQCILTEFDDAANEKLGLRCYIPKYSEWEELYNNCYWSWGALNGVKGYFVKSKTNGRSIFLPAAGYRGVGSYDPRNETISVNGHTFKPNPSIYNWFGVPKSTNFYKVGSWGYYWTSWAIAHSNFFSHLSQPRAYEAAYLRFGSDMIRGAYEDRYIGMSIRPVYR